MAAGGTELLFHHSSKDDDRPERLIAAGEVSGQGTEKENKGEEWHGWL